MQPDASYWNQRYLQDNTTWDMGQVSPPLQAYFSQLQNKNLSILIPGCGNGYEAAWLLQNGFTSITLIDISEVLTQRLCQQFAHLPGLQSTGHPRQQLTDSPSQQSSPIPGASPQIITGDFFDLTGQFDLIIEQTFFCALSPSLRENYVEQMHRLLKPGGKLAGLLFDRDFVPPSGHELSGPPFGGHETEYRQLLEKKFRLKTLAPCYNSIQPRAGSELFFIAEKQH